MADGDTLVTLTADEAGAYEPIEDYYFLDMGTLFRAMAIVSGETSLALQRAHASDEPSSGYINWLEDKLAEARPDLLKEFQAEVEIN